MSKAIHPLFLTRGVPGTHDINLLNETILNFHPLTNNLTISLKTKDFEKFLQSIKRAYNEVSFK